MRICTLFSLIIGVNCSYVNCTYKIFNKNPLAKNLNKKATELCIENQSVHTYKLIINDGILSSKLKHFWKSTGLCPPDPHQESHKFLLSSDMKLNLFHIGSLPHNGISQVRIHWMLDLVELRILPTLKVIYNFNYLDELIHMLWENNLQPGFELMGNPSNFFTDFENKTQVFMWKDLIQKVAEHYIDIYGIKYVMKWNFETWNEPDHHDFDKLNFTIQGFLNYYDACSEGLRQADKQLRFGGPGGSCRIPSAGHSPICWALLEHCVTGRNYFTGKKDVRLDFISFHKKGNGSTFLIIDEEFETIQYILSHFPSLIHVPFYNDEADPLKNWALPQWWRADSTYAAMIAKIVLSHIYFYYLNNESKLYEDIKFDLLSSDDAFLSYFPNQFTERTLLARFQVNNTNPKYVEFIRKPVYAVFGLLSKLCPNILALKVLDNGEHFSIRGSNFGAIATECLTERQIIIVLYNSADTYHDDTIADVHITFNTSKPYVSTPKWAILELNNKISNPYVTWETLGMPAYPNTDAFSLIKDNEEPQMRGPWPVLNSEQWKFHLKILSPGVTLISICDKHSAPKKVENIRFLKIWNQTLQISWHDEYNRCIITYNVLYSSNQSGPYYKLNKKNIIFPSYWHSCNYNGYKCHIEGFYKIYAVDYWGRHGTDSKSFVFKG